MKVNIVIRSSKTKRNGKCPICLRISDKTSLKYIYIGIDVRINDFDVQKSIVRRSDPEYANKNKIILHTRQRADNILTDASIRDEKLNLHSFTRLYTSVSGANGNFFTYVSKILENKYQSKLIAHETYRGNKSQLSKLMQFRPKLQFSEVSKELFEQYKEYMIHQRNNKQSTINKSLTIIKEFCHWAKDDQLIKDNPLQDLKREHYIGDRTFLEAHEVDKLLTVLQSGSLTKGYKRSLRSFLFSCFTGLRYQDVKTLNTDDIKNKTIDNKEIQYISKVQHKTGALVEVPLVNRALELLAMGADKNGLLIDALTNQPTNRYMKKIAALGGIDKLLTFHVARNTFGSMYLDKGLSIEYVSKLLGHKNINTTYQIYTKVNIDMKYRQLMKADNTMLMQLGTH